MTDYVWKLKVKYRPDQPRVPSGSPEGGRWASSRFAGRAPGSPVMGADTKAAAFLAQGLPEVNSLGDKVRDKDGNPVYSGESRPMVKQEIVENLAEGSGLAEEMVNMLVAKWADTSADEDRKALEMQAAAARVFGTEVTPYVSETLGVAKLLNEEGWPLSKKEMDGFVGAMYEHTQRRLAATGFKPSDTITLYRGIGFPRSRTDLSDGDVIDMRQNPLSSWSSAPSEAAKFASHFWGEQASVLIKMEVPVSAIAGTARTGFGSLPECEFIVVGGNDVGHKARVVKVIRDYADWEELGF